MTPSEPATAPPAPAPSARAIVLSSAIAAGRKGAKVGAIVGPLCYLLQWIYAFATAADAVERGQTAVIVVLGIPLGLFIGVPAGACLGLLGGLAAGIARARR